MMRTAQSRLVREAVTFESDAGRYVHIRPRQLPPDCLNRLVQIETVHDPSRPSSLPELMLSSLSMDTIDEPTDE